MWSFSAMYCTELCEHILRSRLGFMTRTSEGECEYEFNYNYNLGQKRQPTGFTHCNGMFVHLLGMVLNTCYLRDHAERKPLG